MNINETITDFDYIQYEIKKISNEHGISFEVLMDDFTDRLLSTDLNSSEVLNGMRGKYGDKNENPNRS